MDIIISNSSKQPIYEQITTQIKQQIMSGLLKEGDSLPSMRLLAKDLHISVITTKRAYEDLERDGFIETIVGKGSFIASHNPEFLKEEQQRIIENHLSEASKISKRCKISYEELVEILGVIYTEEA
ncbi:MAG: GntR family transcriptional regulator [Turicibacter sp.]